MPTFPMRIEVTNHAPRPERCADEQISDGDRGTATGYWSDDTTWYWVQWDNPKINNEDGGQAIKVVSTKEI